MLRVLNGPAYISGSRPLAGPAGQSASLVRPCECCGLAAHSPTVQSPVRAWNKKKGTVGWPQLPIFDFGKAYRGFGEGLSCSSVISVTKAIEFLAFCLWC